MKDAKGHGSNTRGSALAAAHQEKVNQIGRFKIQKSVLRSDWIGAPWQTIARSNRQAVAERIGQSLRADWRNRDNLVRIR